MIPTKTVSKKRDPKAMTLRVLSELAAERASHGHGEAMRIDRRMGRAKGYLGRILRGELRLDVETLFEALEVLEADPADFFARVVGTRVYPERFLARLERLEARGERSVLDRFELRFKGGEVVVKVESGDEIPALAALAVELETLDELSFSDPAEALPQAEDLLLEAVRRLQSKGDTESRGIVARALGLVAAIYRRQARFGVAASCLRLGFRLCELGGCPSARAELLQRACYLVGDQGEYEIALELVREASDAYLLLGDDVGIGKSLIDRAIFQSRSGRPESAVRLYKATFAYLDDLPWRSEYSLYHGLALAYLRLDNLLEATYYGSKASKHHRTRRGPNWSRLAWLRGEVALKLNDIESAEKFLRLALDTLGGEPNLFDFAIVSLRLARALLLDGRTKDVQKIAAGMMQLLHPFRNHRIASAALANVTRAALEGELTIDLLDDVCIELERENGHPTEGCPPGVT